MPDLNAVLSGQGHEDVNTYLQSGNAVLAATRTTAAKLATQVEKALLADLGVDTRVLVRTHSELAALVAANPFPAAAEKPAWFHVAFLSAAPDKKAAGALDLEALAPDEFALGDHAIYLRYVNSPGRSRLAEIVAKAALKGRPDAVATSRNWNTVLKLTELTAP